jgi:hydroxylaminobenzene mutase
MSADEASRRLCWHGIFLFLLGLVTGVLIPAFTNTRMGLSAHLAGVQNGMALVLIGLLWPRLSLGGGLARAARLLSAGSLYAIWLALVLAAAFGTSGATPIAGAGFAGAAWQEWLVTGLLYAGSVAIIVGCALVLHGLRASHRTAPSASA